MEPNYAPETHYKTCWNADWVAPHLTLRSSNNVKMTDFSTLESLVQALYQTKGLVSTTVSSWGRKEWKSTLPPSVSTYSPVPLRRIKSSRERVMTLGPRGCLTNKTPRGKKKKPDSNRNNRGRTKKEQHLLSAAQGQKDQQGAREAKVRGQRLRHDWGPRFWGEHELKCTWVMEERGVQEDFLVSMQSKISFPKEK